MATKTSRRALYITPFVPSPQTEGHRKRISSTISIIEEMEYVVDVVFLCLDDLWLRKASDRWYREMTARYNTFHFVYSSSTFERQGEDWALDDWFADEFRSYIKWIASRVDYDIVYCNYVFLSAALSLFPKSVYKIVDTHDRFGGRRDLLLQNNSPLEFFYTTTQSEADGLSRADVVISLKEEEGRYFGRICDRKILNLPYFEPALQIDADDPPQEPKAMFGFFGSPNMINVKNFERFIEVYRDHPLVSAGRLDIAAFGGICDRLRTPKDDAFQIGGRVADPVDFYKSVQCVIVPQEYSTGLKIKVAEALASGMPMVAHRHAMEGFGELEEGPLACSSFEEMIQYMYRFRDDLEFRGDLQKIVRGVQEDLELTFGRSKRSLARTIQSNRREIRHFVDGPEFVSNSLYENAVRSAVSAFNSDLRTTIVMTRADFLLADRMKSMDRIGAHEIQYCYDSTAEEIGSLIEGFSGPTLYMDIEGYRSAMAGDFRLEGVFFRDLHECLAERNDFEASGIQSDATYSKGWASQRGDSSEMISVSHLRWLAWPLDLAGGPKDFERVDAVYILSTPQTEMRKDRLAQILGPTTDVRGFVVSSLAERGLRDLHDILFVGKQIPKYVIDLTEGAPCVELYREFFYLNQIPIFGTPPHVSVSDMTSRYVSGKLTQAMRGAAEKPQPFYKSRKGPDWVHSGWRNVSAKLGPLLLNAARARHKHSLANV